MDDRSRVVPPAGLVESDLKPVAPSGLLEALVSEVGVQKVAELLQERAAMKAALLATHAKLEARSSS